MTDEERVAHCMVEELLAELQAGVLEKAARLVDPKPGPEPRDFHLHRALKSQRVHLAKAIRALGEEE